MLLVLAFAFLSARFSFRDLAATVLALLFFGDLSAIGHPSLGSTDGFGIAETTPVNDYAHQSGRNIVILDAVVDKYTYA